MRTIDINSDLGESFGNWRMVRMKPQIGRAHV